MFRQSSFYSFGKDLPLKILYSCNLYCLKDVSVEITLKDINFLENYERKKLDYLNFPKFFPHSLGKHFPYKFLYNQNLCHLNGISIKFHYEGKNPRSCEFSQSPLSILVHLHKLLVFIFVFFMFFCIY